ncbi:MAG: hypothetical protein V3V78_01600 [Candidatus Woesearchaeota archaeon]
MPFLSNVIIAFAFIGGHQFFEFLSLITNNQIIYKTGLIISLLAPYFGLRAMEVLLNRNLRSKIVLWLIAAVGIVQIFIPVSFEVVSFYIRHYSPKLWTALWFFIFIYIHICAFTARSKLKDQKSRKTILWFLLAIMDISFILAVLYLLFGSLFLSVNICYDLTSIWCTFAVIQAIFIPFFLSALPFIFKRPSKTIQSWKTTIIYFLISLIIFLLFGLGNNFFGCVVEQLIFR